MWSMLWSMEVSHGVLEYGRSTGVSSGVLEYGRSIGLLGSRGVETLLTVGIWMIQNKVLKLLCKISFTRAYTQYFW
jgi:hypothetical protein